MAADPSDRAGPREGAQEKLPLAGLGDPEGMGSERATWVGLKPRLISGRRVPTQPKPNPSPWSLTGATLPPALPPQHPPHTVTALTSSIPWDRDAQADPGADAGAGQEPGAHLSHQDLALQGPTWKGLG